MQPGQRKSGSGAVGRARIDLFMPADNRISAIDFTDPLSQVTDQFVQRQVLIFRGHVAIEIADEANPEGNVIEIIAVDMPAIELPGPAIPDFNLAVAGRTAVANHEMVS